MQKSIAENTKDTRLNQPYSVAYDPADFHCGVDDTPPVDTQKMWKEEQNCFDHMGLTYSNKKLEFFGYFMLQETSIGWVMN